MPRTTKGPEVKSKRERVFALSKGFRGRANNCYKVAKIKTEKALQYAYRDRRNKKRDFRALWITRINAALKERKISYSKFMGLCIKVKLGIDRKMLSQMAIEDVQGFAKVVDAVISKKQFNESYN